MSEPYEVKSGEGRQGDKPCPFCGSGNLHLVCLQTYRNYKEVVCYDCKATGPCERNEDDAWDRWNKRFREREETF